VQLEFKWIANTVKEVKTKNIYDNDDPGSKNLQLSCIKQLYEVLFEIQKGLHLINALEEYVFFNVNWFPR
jgi:hypothetical protein